MRWKTRYSGRRGAGKAIVEATDGNLAIAQALLRHKSQITTATFSQENRDATGILAESKTRRKAEHEAAHART